MPWHIERRDGEHCVIRDTDGKVEKCHSILDDAQKHMSALYANVHKKSERGFLVKQIDGVWHWVGISTNNWLDRHGQIIMSKAHKRFVEMFDSGEYGRIILESPLVSLPGKIGSLFKDIAERGTPDLWYWHLPAPIGYVTDIAFDERGYLIAMGVQKEGEPYSSIFKAISDSDVLHGMSHAMPDIMIQFEMGKPDMIAGYISTEFTVLPDDAAANIGTAFSTFKKEAVMRIPEEKLSRMTKAIGEEAVAQIDGLLSELDEFANEANIPRKETNMSDQTEVVDALEVEEVETEEVETEEAETAATTEDETVANASEEVEPDGTGTSQATDPAEFQVPETMRAFAEEMTAGLQKAFADFAAVQDARFGQLQKQLDAQTAEIAKLKEADESRVAEKAADTPVASMSGWMARRIGSVIGQEGARLNGSTERSLFNKTKEFESDAIPAAAAGAPATIQGFLSRQQGGRRFVVASADEQGQ